MPIPVVADADALVDSGRKNSLRDAKAHEALMRNALPNAMVETADVQAQFEAVEPAVRQAKDMHVAACACHLVAANAYPEAGAVVLTSGNARDFVKTRLAALGIAFQGPDAFLLSLFRQEPTGFAAAFRAFREDLRSRPDVLALIAKLDSDGHRKTAAALRVVQARDAKRL